MTSKEELEVLVDNKEGSRCIAYNTIKKDLEELEYVKWELEIEKEKNATLEEHQRALTKENEELKKRIEELDNDDERND